MGRRCTLIKFFCPFLFLFAYFSYICRKFSIMVENIRIRNYKSIVDLTLDLGRFNVIIGTNGCGKSNILEAVTMASAAHQNKLDTEFLLNRNVRVTEPAFMTNAFDDVERADNHIYLDVKGFDKQLYSINFNLFHQDKTKTWKNFIEAASTLPPDSKMTKYGMFQVVAVVEEFASFLSYRPVENLLREVKDSPIYPLGIRGEGLMQYLKTISTNEEYRELFLKINEGLRMLDWFDGFNIPDGLLTNEYKLSIGDKFLKDSLHHFDQRSTNEGFLYLLFFLTLFNSKDTPQFFAVDNIETSFNPGLCQNLTKYLVKTTKENNKQVVLTTHNPFVLDGMDLSDDEVRLFVCRRDIDGHTKIERVKYREDRKMSLSELWMSGLIGALPDNF